MASDHSIAIVGVGPRGTYALIRLLALLNERPPTNNLTIHLVEPNELGAGIVYKTTQPGYLLMNTVASQITAFTDESVIDEAPRVYGPTLYEWLRTQGTDIGPEDYPTRAHHGQYLAWVVSNALQRLPPRTTVLCHNTTVADIIPTDKGKHLVLGNGDSVYANKILLTAGNVGNQDAKPQLASGIDNGELRNYVHYIPNPYPIEHQISCLPTGSAVGVLGLGLTSLDIMIAATEGKGGRFVRASNGMLTYEACGNEPRLFAWSRSGYPLLSRGVNQKGLTGQYTAKFLSVEALNLLKVNHGKLDFYQHIFPLLVDDMAYAYYESLEGHSFAEEFRRIRQRGESAAPLLSSIPLQNRFSWDWLVSPPELVQTVYEDAAAYREALLQYLRNDVDEARKGNLGSPIKAACDVLRDLRDNVRYAVEFESLTPRSHKYFNEEFSPINNRLAVGPPAFRTEQMIALIIAGVLDIGWGGRAAVSVDEASRKVAVESTAFRRNRSVALDVLVDGRAVPLYSELIRNLVLRRITRLAVNRDPSFAYSLRTLEVTRDGMIVNAAGEIDEGLFAMGQLAEGTVWYTQVAARPGVNSRALREAGRWAVLIRESM